MKKDNVDLMANGLAIILFIGCFIALTLGGPMGFYIPLGAIGGFYVMKWLLTHEGERK